jgi:hypothetical protein
MIKDGQVEDSSSEGLLCWWNTPAICLLLVEIDGKG